MVADVNVKTTKNVKLLFLDLSKLMTVIEDKLERLDRGAKGVT